MPRSYDESIVQKIGQLQGFRFSTGVSTCSNIDNWGKNKPRWGRGTAINYSLIYKRDLGMKQRNLWWCFYTHKLYYCHWLLSYPPVHTTGHNIARILQIWDFNAERCLNQQRVLNIIGSTKVLPDSFLPCLALLGPHPSFSQRRWMMPRHTWARVMHVLSR
jgi:hypothetical protein